MAKSRKGVRAWLLSLLFVSGGVVLGETSQVLGTRSAPLNAPNQESVAKNVTSTPSINNKTVNSSPAVSPIKPIVFTNEMIETMKPKVLAKVEVSNLDQIQNCKKLFQAFGVDAQAIPAIMASFAVMGVDFRALDADYRVTAKVISLSDDQATQKNIEMYLFCLIFHTSTDKDIKQNLLNKLRASGVPFLERANRIIVTDSASIERLTKHKKLEEKLAKAEVFTVEKTTSKVPHIHVQIDDPALLVERVITLAEKTLPFDRGLLDPLRSHGLKIDVSLKEDHFEIIASLEGLNIKDSDGFRVSVPGFYGFQPQDYMALRLPQEVFSALFDIMVNFVKQIAGEKSKKVDEQEWHDAAAFIHQIFEFLPESCLVSEMQESYAMTVASFPNFNSLDAVEEKIKAMKREMDALDKKYNKKTDEQGKPVSDKEKTLPNFDFITKFLAQQEIYRGWRIDRVKDEALNLMARSEEDRAFQRQMVPQYFVTLKDGKLFGATSLTQLKTQIDAAVKGEKTEGAGLLEDGELFRQHLTAKTIVKIMLPIIMGPYQLTQEEQKSLKVNVGGEANWGIKIDIKAGKMESVTTLDYAFIESIIKVGQAIEAIMQKRRMEALRVQKTTNPHSFVPANKTKEMSTTSSTSNTQIQPAMSNQVLANNETVEEQSGSPMTLEAIYPSIDATAYNFPQSVRCSDRYILIPVKTAAEYRVIG